MEQSLAVINWTEFLDMHSGGDQKLEWAHVFIEAPEAEAVAIFKRRFLRDPNNVSCDCCGEDFAIYEGESLKEMSRYSRGCSYDNGEDARDTSMDYSYREMLRKDHKKMPEKIQKLWAMAKDKSSPNEAAIAFEKIIAEENMPWWPGFRYVPFEEFEQTGRLSGRFGDKGVALILRAADIASDRNPVSVAQQ
jgi:hypothetical protein